MEALSVIQLPSNKSQKCRQNNMEALSVIRLPSNKSQWCPQKQHESSVCDAITIKQEPVEDKLFISPKQEIEYIYVKEETSELGEPDGYNRAQDPLHIVKKEDLEEPDGHNSVQDPLNIVKEESEEPDGHNSAQDPLNIAKEESSPSEEFLGSSTYNIDKTENIEDEEEKEEEEKEGVSQDDWEEHKHEVQATSSCTEQESINFIEVNDDKRSGDRRIFVAKVAGTENRTQSATLKEPSCSNKTGTSRVAQLEDLKEHPPVGGREIIHSCNVCHKTFAGKKILKRHLRLHTGERPYSCSICSKTFKESDKLKKHSLLHTGERPYSCCICKKTFAENGDLKKHSRLHTGDVHIAVAFATRRSRKMFT